MRGRFRVTLLSLRDLVATAAAVRPPRRRAARGSPTGCSTRRRRASVVLATGQDQGAYAEFGKRYVADPEGERHQVRLRKTAGAAENIALLREPGGEVDIAFVQGGADDARPRVHR